MSENFRYPSFTLNRAFVALILFAAEASFCQYHDGMVFGDNLKTMSLEDLMDIDVTLVSKHPEN